MSAVAGRKGWDRAVREHHAALDAFLATVRDYPDAEWRRPRGEGKWSPAEVAEHVALLYQALLAELDGAPPMRPLVGPVTARLARWVVLPHILFHRSIPLRVSAPREIRPQGVLPGPDETARKLQELAGRFEERLAAAGDARTTHPYFGFLSAVPALRFCAAHMEHHHRQIAGPSSR